MSLKGRVVLKKEKESNNSWVYIPYRGGGPKLAWVGLSSPGHK